MNAPRLAVILPTRNPSRERLTEVLRGFARQTAPDSAWEALIVDNGSAHAVSPYELEERSGKWRVVHEDRPGLLHARAAGIAATDAEYLVFVDDDTIPSEDFVDACIELLDQRPSVGTAGGRITPRFLAPPPAWIGEVDWALALRDAGPAVLEWSPREGTPLPSWTPIGAGMLARRAALVPSYLDHVQRNTDTITRLSWTGQGSGGVEDKDLVLHTLRGGWSTAYSPRMKLTHVIPEGRLDLAYFERLIPGLTRMWALTLFAHGFEQHRAIHPLTLPLRQAKAWFAFKAWKSRLHRLRWLQSCAYLGALAANYRSTPRYALPQPLDP